MSSEQRGKEKPFLVRDEIRDGVFVNIFKIYRKADEIILDFGRSVPDREEAEVKARVVVTVEGAKALMELIKDFVEREPSETFEKRTLPYVG